jgi:hypothetical protein
MNAVRRLFPPLLALFFGAALLPAVEPPAGDPEPPKAEDVGTFIDLQENLRLHLFVEENQVVAQFVDTEDHILAPPAESILFIVDDPGHREDEWRTVLKPEEGAQRLTSPRRLYGPYNFRSRIIIRFTDREPSAFTNHPVDLQRNLSS